MQLLKARAWTEILPSAVTFKNAYRARKPDADGGQVPLPQSFSFMLRKGGVYKVKHVNPGATITRWWLGLRPQGLVNFNM